MTDRNEDATAPATTAGPTATAPWPTQAPAPVEAPAAPAGPATTIDDGVYEVGVDVAPGKYKTAGGSGALCYWDQKKEPGGNFGAGDDQGVAEAGEPQVVTLVKGRYFKTSDCGTWKKQ